MFGQDQVAFFQFFDGGELIIDLTAKKAADPAFSGPTRQWGTWHEDSGDYTFTTPPPAFHPKYEYLLKGEWTMDGDHAEFTVWNRHFPTLSKGKAIGEADRCSVELPMAPQAKDWGP